MSEKADAGDVLVGLFLVAYVGIGLLIVAAVARWAWLLLFR